jgi:hypothetical protein
MNILSKFIIQFFEHVLVKESLVKPDNPTIVDIKIFIGINFKIGRFLVYGNISTSIF